MGLGNIDYFDFKKRKFVCDYCGWCGPNVELQVLEIHNNCAEYICPRCETWVGCVYFPSVSEYLAHYEELNPSEKAQVSEMIKTRDRFHSMALSHPSQLPDIADRSIVLLWDQETSVKDNCLLTIIRHHHNILWKEPSIFEGAERFVQIVKILKAKYGPALEDVVPLKRTHTYLFGDNSYLPSLVLRTREELGCSIFVSMKSNKKSITTS